MKYNEIIKTIKNHKAAAKAKLKKLKVCLSQLPEIEKQLRIIQSCNNSLRKYHALNANEHRA